MLVVNCLFRAGGAAAVMTNMWVDGWRDGDAAAAWADRARGAAPGRGSAHEHPAPPQNPNPAPLAPPSPVRRTRTSTRCSTRSAPTSGGRTRRSSAWAMARCGGGEGGGEGGRRGGGDRLVSPARAAARPPPRRSPPREGRAAAGVAARSRRAAAAVCGALFPLPPVRRGGPAAAAAAGDRCTRAGAPLERARAAAADLGGAPDRVRRASSSAARPQTHSLPSSFPLSGLGRQHGRLPT